MASILTQVRQMVLDGVSATSAFTTPDPTTKQKPDVRFGWAAGWNAREKVFTGAVEFSHDVVALKASRTVRDEDATFDLTLLIAGLGQTEKQVSDRMDVLGQAVEDWVAVHANWSGAIPGLKWVVIKGDGSQTPMFNDKGVLVERVYPISYQARLT